MENTSLLLWGAMIVYGLAMFLRSPKVHDAGQFFAGKTEDGRDIGMGMLVATVVISWIFAKSITNSANLGFKFGLVGAVAYAGWYLSIPVAGIVIYQLRTRYGHSSLAGFLGARYGQGAVAAFLLVILLRLVNEVWSNSAVVGTYFGASSTVTYFAGALVFTVITLAYSLRGGLRSSILTDLLQFGLGIFLLVFVLALVIPKSGAGALLSSGEWTMVGGVDLLLVALLQSLSYPFHDPVLTDRAFITKPAAMLKGYLIAGVIATSFIVLFGLVGAHGMLAGLTTGQDAPIRVAESFGVGMMVVMSLLMMISAGSTLDSTLSSFSRALVLDTGDGKRAPKWLGGGSLVDAGRKAMVLAIVVGSLPLFAGATILKATTVSGTMVLGLAPAFLFFALRQSGAFAFHLGFWPGVIIGTMHALNRIPESWAIGDGSYAALLGANVVGTGLVFGGFLLGTVLDATVFKRRAAATAAMLLLLPTLALAGDKPHISFGGQTMLRTTFKMVNPDRPSSELYNLRLIGKATQGNHSFLTEIRFRQSKLRSYSPSNVWLQQAYGSWRAQENLHLDYGLIYNQLGLFWDGSWFGNLPYLDGHKLDPDMNVQLRGQHQLNDTIGLNFWLQGSPGEDGLNGSFSTAGRQARLGLSALAGNEGNEGDPEASTTYREALSARARLQAVLQLGDSIRLLPGASVQRSSYDEKITDGIQKASQLVHGLDLTLEKKDTFQIFGEILNEELEDFSDGDFSRSYVVAGGQVELPKGDFNRVTAGLSWQSSDKADEGFEETFFTGRVHARFNDLVGTTVEYVRWELDGDDDPLLNRVEFILHLYY